MKTINTLLAMTVTGLLAGCGGSGDDSSVTPPPVTGTFSLGVSDNPSDVEDVTIAFKHVVLKNSTGSTSFEVASNGALKQVNLLDFQGSKVEQLVTGKDVPVGEYQMCIYMERSETANENSSYVKTHNGNLYGLTTNSNGSCGGVGAEDANTGRLFFNKPFTIAAGVNNFVAEFDLNSGLQKPHGNKAYWTLKPTSVQLHNVVDVGSIKGTIPSALTSECEIAAAGSDFHQAVYLYPQSTSLDNMSDFRGAATPAPQVAPIAAARVNDILNANNQVIGQGYELGFVVAGNYSLGYTCVAQNDDPEAINLQDDAAPFFIFADIQAVAVRKGAATEANFLR